MAQARFYTDYATAPRPNRPRRPGVAAALFFGGRVLFELRADSDYWAFISGGVKDDESVMSAVRLEIAEESSAQLAGDPRLYAVYSNPGRIIAYPDGNVSQIITFAFVGQLSASAIASSAESRQLRFFDLTDLRIAPTHADFAWDLLTAGPDWEGARVD
jgi:8-oxo-dGTP pyrophosphatase MutT (NUDIX family)